MMSHSHQSVDVTDADALYAREYNAAAAAARARLHNARSKHLAHRRPVMNEEAARASAKGTLATEADTAADDFAARRVSPTRSARFSQISSSARYMQVTSTRGAKSARWLAKQAKQEEEERREKERIVTARQSARRAVRSASARWQPIPTCPPPVSDLRQRPRRADGTPCGPYYPEVQQAVVKSAQVATVPPTSKIAANGWKARQASNREREMERRGAEHLKLLRAQEADRVRHEELEKQRRSLEARVALTHPQSRRSARGSKPLVKAERKAAQERLYAPVVRAQGAGRAASPQQHAQEEEEEPSASGWGWFGGTKATATSTSPEGSSHAAGSVNA